MIQNYLHGLGKMLIEVIQSYMPCRLDWQTITGRMVKREVVSKAQQAHTSKTICVYCNYDTSTSNKRKNPALESLSRASFGYNPGRKPFDQYVYDLAHSRFVVSPPGNGPDCHRTWEALYLGAIRLSCDQRFWTCTRIYRCS